MNDKKPTSKLVFMLGPLDGQTIDWDGDKYPVRIRFSYLGEETAIVYEADDFTQDGEILDDGMPQNETQWYVHVTEASFVCEDLTMDKEFWSKVNAVMNNDDRIAFNAWRQKTYLLAATIRDRARSEESMELVKLLNEIPDMRSK